MKYILLFLGVACLMLVSSHKAYAKSSPNGVTVSPAIEQINLTQNQTTSTFATTITNSTPSPVVVSISAEDFTTLNQNGGISFLSNRQDVNNPHGLADQLRIGLTQVALSPGQSQTVPVVIEGTNTLAAGGHYAAIVFKAVNSSIPRGNNITINQATVSLIFLTTYGGGTQTLNLTTPGFTSFYATFPQTITAIFADNGNTQTTPRGVVQIFNRSSKLVSQGVFNINSGLILPGSTRLFNLTLSPQTNKRLWPGIYNVKIFYRHDGQNNYLVYQKSFLYINSWIVLTGAIVVLVLVILFLRILSRRSSKYIARKQRLH